MNDLFQKDINKKMFNAVFEFFHYDLAKTLHWFTTKNPHLGGVSPLVLISKDRANYLWRWIERRLDENKLEGKE